MKKFIILILCFIFCICSCIGSFAEPIDCRESFILDGYDDGRQNINISDISLTGDFFTVQYYSFIGLLQEITYYVVSVNGQSFYSFYNNDNILVDAILCINDRNDTTIYGVHSLGVDIHDIASGQVFNLGNSSTFNMTVIGSLKSSSGMFCNLVEDIRNQLSIETNGSTVISPVKVCTVKNVLYSPYNGYNDLFSYLSSFSLVQLNIWQSIINFVMLESSAIVLLSLFAWLFVTGIGGIRRLITGV